MGGFANNAPIVTDGIVFYVDAGNDNSYPGSGTTWSDLIGSDDATLTNGPTYSSSNGGYIDYDGTNDYVVSSGNLPALNSLSALSVCGFFKIDDSSTIADSSGLTVFIDTTKLTGGSAFSPTDTSNTVYIGSRSTSTNEIMNGSIACLSIYNKALTDAEVTQNYNALKNRFV